MRAWNEAERSIVKTYRKELWARFVRAISEYDMIQENDVIAFLCDGDIGDLIVVTNKARIYKFNWGAWDYERVRAFCGSRALGTPLISPDKKIIHEKNWESEYMGFGSFLFMKNEWYGKFKALEEKTNSTEFVLTLWPDLFLYLLTH